MLLRLVLGLTLAILLSCPFLHAQSETGKTYDKDFVSIIIRPGWVVSESKNHTLNILHGKYLLSINPVFSHASGVEGGRFSEITAQMPSVNAVMANVDQPASGGECAQWYTTKSGVNKKWNSSQLYSDRTKTGNGCVFPSGEKPAWFGSLYDCEPPQGECTITLSYDTSDVNLLPKKGSVELAKVFEDVNAMLRTLHFKTLIVISRVDPPAAPPGATVTVHGSGFRSPGYTTFVRLSDVFFDLLSPPVIAADGKSLTFRIPTSNEVSSCQEGRIEIKGFCLPIPEDHVDVNDCPRPDAGPGNLCGVPIIPGAYQISVGFQEPSIAASTTFTITEPKPTPVTITLMYPNFPILPG